MGFIPERACGPVPSLKLFLKTFLKHELHEVETQAGAPGAHVLGSACLVELAEDLFQFASGQTRAVVADPDLAPAAGAGKPHHDAWLGGIVVLEGVGDQVHQHHGKQTPIDARREWRAWPWGDIHRDTGQQRPVAIEELPRFHDQVRNDKIPRIAFALDTRQFEDPVDGFPQATDVGEHATGDFHRVALQGQIEPQAFGDVAFVFDDENPLGAIGAHGCPLFWLAVGGAGGRLTTKVAPCPGPGLSAWHLPRCSLTMSCTR